MDWFTSDLHFCHEKMVELRGYKFMEEMNYAILDSINSRCKKDDTLYVIGDISCNAKRKEHVELIASILPKLVLIKGNHDNREKNGKLIYHEHLHEFHHDLIRGFEDDGGKQFIHMYHYPLSHWYLQNRGTWHLHGHLHGAPSLTQGKVMDVGWDIFRRPISYLEVKELMSREKVRANHHSGVYFDDN